MTNDSLVKARIHFNLPMVGQYDVIFIGTLQRFNLFKIEATRVSQYNRPLFINMYQTNVHLYSIVYFKKITYTII